MLDREELAADVALEAVFGVDVLRVSRQGALVAKCLVAKGAYFAPLFAVCLVHNLHVEGKTIHPVL